MSATVSVFNGWNSVVDNNEEKSLQANLTYKLKDELLLQALDFGGVERAPGAPEGRAFRHLLDAFGQYDATRWLSVAGQIDDGWESTRMGTADWFAGALYARVKPMQRMYVVLRGDRFHESLARASGTSSSPIFWGGIEWVSSGTVTLDLRPHDQMSIRVEYRHDEANAPLYFGTQRSRRRQRRNPLPRQCEHARHHARWRHRVVLIDARNEIAIFRSTVRKGHPSWTPSTSA